MSNQIFMSLMSVFNINTQIYYNYTTGYEAQSASPHMFEPRLIQKYLQCVCVCVCMCESVVSYIMHTVPVYSKLGPPRVLNDPIWCTIMVSVITNS